MRTRCVLVAWLTVVGSSLLLSGTTVAAPADVTGDHKSPGGGVNITTTPVVGGHPRLSLLDSLKRSVESGFIFHNFTEYASYESPEDLLYDSDISNKSSPPANASRYADSSRSLVDNFFKKISFNSSTDNYFNNSFDTSFNKSFHKEFNFDFNFPMNPFEFYAKKPNETIKTTIKYHSPSNITMESETVKGEIPEDSQILKLVKRKLSPYDLFDINPGVVNMSRLPPLKFNSSSYSHQSKNMTLEIGSFKHPNGSYYGKRITFTTSRGSTPQRTKREVQTIREESDSCSTDASGECSQSTEENNSGNSNGGGGVSNGGVGGDSEGGTGESFHSDLSDSLDMLGSDMSSMWFDTSSGSSDDED